MSSGSRRGRQLRLVPTETEREKVKKFADCCGCPWRWDPRSRTDPITEATEHTRRTEHPTIARFSEG